MRITAIIVSYNVSNHLDACLSSIAGKDGDVETVVVDNGSSDGSVEMVKTRHPWVRVMANHGNLGFARAVNLGFAEVSTPLAVFLNPDAVVIGDALKKMADFMLETPGCGIAGCRVLKKDYTLQGSARGFPDFSTPFFGRTSFFSRILPGNRLTSRNLPLGGAESPADHQVSPSGSILAGQDPRLIPPGRVDWVSGACMMVKSDVFRALGGFDEGFFMYWEDADLCRRALEIGFWTWYVPGPAVIHFTGRSSVGRPLRCTAEFYRSAFRYYRKHMSPSHPAAIFADIAVAGGAVIMAALVMAKIIFNKLTFINIIVIILLLIYVIKMPQ